LRYGKDFYAPETQSFLGKLMNGIYIQPHVNKFDKVDETLIAFRNAGADSYILTHGNERTTGEKIAHAGLNEIVAGVYCVDDLGLKDATTWRKGYKHFGIIPEKSLVVGDSWTSDIEPAIQIGVPKDQIFRVRTPYDEANKSKVGGICEIDAFHQVVDMLLEL
jgi:FMN phosphatase YigB (HAD superfamily)